LFWNLEPDKWAVKKGWKNVKEAKEIVQDAIDKYKELGGKLPKK
jgi:inorganic pyrophosphatase